MIVTGDKVVHKHKGFGQVVKINPRSNTAKVDFNGVISTVYYTDLRFPPKNNYTPKKSVEQRIKDKLEELRLVDTREAQIVKCVLNDIMRG